MGYFSGCEPSGRVAMNPNSQSLQPPRNFSRQDHLLASIEECDRHIRRFRLQLAAVVTSALLMAVVIAGHS
jgi:hypothetical protein